MVEILVVPKEARKESDNLLSRVEAKESPRGNSHPVAHGKGMKKTWRAGHAAGIAMSLDTSPRIALCLNELMPAAVLQDSSLLFTLEDKQPLEYLQCSS